MVLTCRDSNGNLHKLEQTPAKYLYEKNWFVDLAARLWQTFHCFLRSFVLRWAAFASNKCKHPAPRLRDDGGNEILSPIENFVIRRRSITKCLWMTDSVSSLSGAIPARRSACVCELAHCTIRDL